MFPPPGYVLYHNCYYDSMRHNDESRLAFTNAATPCAADGGTPLPYLSLQCCANSSAPASTAVYALTHVLNKLFTRIRNVVTPTPAQARRSEPTN